MDGIAARNCPPGTVRLHCLLMIYLFIIIRSWAVYLYVLFRSHLRNRNRFPKEFAENINPSCQPGRLLGLHTYLSQRIKFYHQRESTTRKVCDDGADVREFKFIGSKADDNLLAFPYLK